MKTLIKKTLHNFGYELIRSENVNYPKGDFWNDWFNHFPIDLTNSYISNRNSLKKITTWLDESTYDSSNWGYGVPLNFFNGKYKYSLNYNPCEFTYSDLLVAIGRKLGAVNFLEIGVSAGKNLYQMYTSFENSNIYGMDIEEINPTLLSSLSEAELTWKSKEVYDFTNKKGQVVKKIFTSRKFKFATNNNTVYYLSGDKFNGVLWDQLKGVQFNMIFSDAFHKPESIKNEFDILKNNDLIDKKNFVMMWDDLDGEEMQDAFLKICDELSNGIFKGKESMFKLYDLHGTYAGLHKIGLFCSFQHRELRRYLSSR